MPKDEAKLLEVPPRTRAIADSPTVSTPGSGLHDKAALWTSSPWQVPGKYSLETKGIGEALH